MVNHHQCHYGKLKYKTCKTCESVVSSCHFKVETCRKAEVVHIGSNNNEKMEEFCALMGKSIKSFNCFEAYEGYLDPVVWTDASIVVFDPAANAHILDTKNIDKMLMLGKIVVSTKSYDIE